MEKMLKENQFDAVWYSIYDEGLDYCFRHYSGWEAIEDPEFHSLRKAYIAAAEALEGYVTDNCTRDEDEPA